MFVWYLWWLSDDDTRYTCERVRVRVCLYASNVKFLWHLWLFPLWRHNLWMMLTHCWTFNGFIALLSTGWHKSHHTIDFFFWCTFDGMNENLWFRICVYLMFWFCFTSSQDDDVCRVAAAVIDDQNWLRFMVFSITFARTDSFSHSWRILSLSASRVCGSHTYIRDMEKTQENEIWSGKIPVQIANTRN